METFAKAYLGNPTLEARRAQLRGADENVTQALSLWRPSVTGTASAGVGYSYTDPALDAHQTRTPASVQVEVVQPLYRGGRNPAALAEAENFVLSERAALLSVEQDVLQQAGTAYMNVVRDQAVVELNLNNEEVLRRQLQATRDRFQVGEVTRTDVSQAEARLSRAIADRRAAEGDLETSRADYEQIVGVPPGVLVQPDPLPGLPASRREAIERSQVDNPAVIQAIFAHIAASKSVGVVEGEMLPSASLVGQVRQSYESTVSNSDTFNAQATAQVTIPLYQSGSVRSRVRQAKQVASQRMIQVEEARRAAIEAATAGWEQLAATRNRIRALQAEVEAQQIAVDGVQQEALVGTRTVLDVLNAEQELLNARVNLIRAQRDEMVASLSLASAVGLLAAEPLNLDVPRYDVRAHYEEVRGRWFGTEIGSPWRPADK
jgi:TolC family type I secretion outer membrane protein